MLVGQIVGFSDAHGNSIAFAYGSFDPNQSVDLNLGTNPPDTPYPWEGHLAPTGRVATWRSLLQRRKWLGFVNPERAGGGCWRDR